MTTASGARFLILGGSGQLGSRLLEVLGEQYTAFGTRLSRPAGHLLACDLTRSASVESVLKCVRPDVIVHAAGMTRPDECEADPVAARSVNVTSLATLVRLARAAKLLMFSTDYVFDGVRGLYTDRDQPAPVNQYGASKLAAERELLRLRPNALVIRVAGLFGYSRTNREFLDQFSKGERLVCSQDHVSSYTYIDDVARLLPGVLHRSGVIHMVGPDIYSRVGFARLVCRELGCLRTTIVAEAGTVAYPGARRPEDSSLVSSDLGSCMTVTVQALREIRARLADDGYDL